MPGRIRNLISVSLPVALVLSCRGLPAAEFSAAFHSITSPDIKTHIDVLADDSFEGREAGTRGGRAAGGYLVQRLEQLNLAPAGDGGSYYQTLQGGLRNVLAVLEGSDPELREEYVLVGAHYDHVGYGNRKNSYGPFGYVHNGADDNASGVAGVLEIAEAFSMLDERPARSILFAFWDGEEKGLLGSKHWTAYPTRPLSQIAFAVNIDMIGRLRNEELNVFGSRTGQGLRRLVSESNRDSDLTLDFTWELKANSDHHPFFAKSIPVLMLHSGLHDDYHRPSDDAHKINHDGASSASRLLFGAVYSLADRTDRLAFRKASRFESLSDQAAFQQPATPRGPRLGVDWQQDEASGGLLVRRVTSGSAAARAGVRPGDRLVQIDGREYSSLAELKQQILAAPSRVTLKLARSENTTLETVVQLAGQPLRWGFAWREDQAEPRSVMLSEVVPGSAADQAGLQPGDRIYQVDGADFDGSQGFLETLHGLQGSAWLLVERRGHLREMEIAPPAVPDDDGIVLRTDETDRLSDGQPEDS